MVLMVENLWSLGRILEVKPNTEERRACEESQAEKSAVLERAIDKIVLLEAPRFHESS